MHVDLGSRPVIDRRRRVYETRIRPFLEKIAYRLGIWIPRKLDAAVSAFIEVNARHWRPQSVVSRDRVLIEGHLADYGPNYLVRTAIAARALQEIVPLEIEVVFNGYSSRWEIAKRVYRSCGISRFTFLGSRFLCRNIWYFIVSYFKARRIAAAIKEPREILGIKYDNIKVGDLIYDDILKICAVETVEELDARAVRTIRRSYFFYLQYKSLFAAANYRYYVSTHTAYSEYGILCRVALARGVPVIETTDIQMSYYNTIADDKLPTYHDGIRSAIERVLAQSAANTEEFIDAARQALTKRLNSQVNQIDAQKAYRGHTYTRELLLEKLHINSEGKIIFILAHVFSDAPHLSSGMLHADYFQWLMQTLAVCARVQGVTWIVKPHPSSAIYGENGRVEQMVEELRATNVKLSPADLNTRSLELCADALVTVHGTAGLEFSCVGIPTLLAGRPFYSRFGFTLDPVSMEAYESALCALKDVEPLSAAQCRRALQIYGIWDQQFDWNNPLFTPEVLANVWGSERPRDLPAAYEQLAVNLRTTDPRELRLWKFVQSIARDA